MIVCVTKITVASSRKSHVESPLFVEMTNQNFPLTIAVNHLLFSQLVSPFHANLEQYLLRGKNNLSLCSATTICRILSGQTIISWNKCKGFLNRINRAKFCRTDDTRRWSVVAKTS